MSVPRVDAMRPTSRRAAWVPIGLGAFVVLGIVLNLSNPPGMLAFVPYSVVGSLLVARRPRNVIGWLLVVLAVAFSMVGRGPQLTAALYETPWANWLPVLAWVGTMAAIGLFAGLGLLTAVFPTGALPAGNVGRATRAALALIVGVLLLQAVDPVFMTQLPDGTTIVLRNPIGLFPDWPGWSLLDGPAYLLVLAAILVCTVGLLIRFRRAGTIEREQDKWFLASLAVLIAAIAFGFVVTALVDPQGAWGWFPALLSFPLPPLAIGIAIMRYRLYEIDRIVSRTIAYAGLTVVLFAVFAGVNLALRSLLDPVVGGGSVTVAASTLAIAALFNPVRVRLQRIVDRRFNRGRSDAELTVEGFAGRLRNQLDLDTIGGELTRAAIGAVEPVRAAVWLRQAGAGRVSPGIP